MAKVRASKQNPIVITVTGADEFITGMGLAAKRGRDPFGRGVQGRVEHEIAVENGVVFRSEGQSIGARWRPLTEPYASWKATHFPGRPILVRTGRMRQGMTNPQHPDFKTSKPNKLKLVYRTNSRYAGYHQTGTRKMVSRPLVKPTRAFVRRIGEHVRDGITGVQITSVRPLFGE